MLPCLEVGLGVPAGRMRPPAGRFSAPPGVPGSPSAVVRLIFAEFQSGREELAEAVLLPLIEATELPTLRTDRTVEAVVVLGLLADPLAATRVDRAAEAVDVWPRSTVEVLRVRVALEGCEGGWETD